MRITNIDELHEALKRQAALKQEHRELKSKAAEIYNEYKAIEAHCFHFMQDRDPDDIIGHTEVGGVAYTPSTTIRTKVINEEDFIAWAEQQDETLFETKVKPREAEVNRLVRTLVDNGEPLPPGLELRLQQNINTTKG
jgi:hypothetical protein